uniref:Maltase n=1 Tax=Tetradesmus obliquus TaxID=3088 RepID=A0A383VTZ3_TETOB|eukprot:jgi/Sobl393_1/16040/SZX68671.1
MIKLSTTAIIFYLAALLSNLCVIGVLGGHTAGPAAARQHVQQQVAAPRAGSVTSATTYTVKETARDGLAYSAQLEQLPNDPLPQYGPSFQQLTWQVSPETPSRLRVTISPTAVKRWRVPHSIVPRPGAAAGLTASSLLYDVSLPEPGAPFALQVTRRATGQTIFDTTGHQFIFKDQFIQLTTNMPADADLYGLGEATLRGGLLLPRNNSVVTMWNRDLASASVGFNLYGSHPFYLQVTADGTSHGVLLLNSNGMDVLLNQTSLTYRAIGGLVELYLFLGPTPEAVIRQYHELIGKTAMQPYWALGAHQSKWGYQNLSIAAEAVANYSAAGIPLECLFVDIEYMSDNFRTMTFSEDRYPAEQMRALVQQLHAKGQRWVPILNPGVGTQKGFRAYEDGNRNDIWIKDFTGQKPYLGQVWPGPAYYPDYLASKNVSSWLKRHLRAFYEQAPFDGVWLDMNEASNFCSGTRCELDTGNATKLHLLKQKTPKDFELSEFFMPRVTCQLKCEQPPASDKLSNPPYKIRNMGYENYKGDAPLQMKSISPTALHADGTKEYDAHNLYGTAMAMRHHEALVAITGERPFILSRSTFPGAGRYVAHWTGDNSGNWHELYHSIAGVLSANMWGIAMTGADICGFNDVAFDNVGWPPKKVLPGPEYEEMCNRWTMAGAFYPFSRNHMTIGHLSRSHEPYQWRSVTAAHRKAYGLRYQLLTYIYSSLFVAHSRGGTLARPLLFTDSSDAAARNATAQWMLGEALLVSPVITPNTTRITPHFTAGTWYLAWDFSKVNVTAGKPVPLDVPVGDLAVHFRGGAVIPMQPYANVTRDVRYAPVTLIVTLPAQPSSGSQAAATAQGPLPPHVLDEPCAAALARHAGQLVSCGLLYSDGDAVKVSASNSLQVWYIAATAPAGRSGSVRSAVKANAGPGSGKLRIESLIIAGVPTQLQGSKPTASLGSSGSNGSKSAARKLPVVYDAAVGTLRISGIDLDAGQALDLSWSL